MTFVISILSLHDALPIFLLRLAPLLVVVVGVAGAENGEGAVGVTTRALDYEVAIRIARAALEDRVVVATTADLIDRKSTRLNSSHLVISYAVFCLKNKTN